MPETNGTTNGTTNGAPPVDASLTVKANDAAAVPGLIKQISALGEGVDISDNVARQELAAKAKALWQSLETPRETMIRHCWAQVSALAASL